MEREIERRNSKKRNSKKRNSKKRNSKKEIENGKKCTSFVFLHYFAC